MQAAGLPVDERYIYHTSAGNPVGGREGAEYLLSLDEIPSGIVCYNDFLAVGVYNYLQEKGLRIPQDVSVTGFDNISIAAYLSPPLTTLHQYKFELGEGAARMMLEVLSYRQREETRKPNLQEGQPERDSEDSGIHHFVWIACVKSDLRDASNLFRDKWLTFWKIMYNVHVCIISA